MAIRFFTLRSKSGGGNVLMPGAPGNIEPFLRQQPSQPALPFQHWIFREGVHFRDLEDVITPFGEHDPSHVVRIVNRATSEVVDAFGGTPLHQGQELQVYPDADDPNQRWALFAVGNHELSIQAAVDTGLSWDVPDASSDPGKKIQLYPLHGHANQLWIVEPAISFEHPVLIRSVENGHTLDVPEFSTAQGKRIQHYEQNGGLNQLWSLEETAAGSGLFVIRSLSSNLVLDVPADANNPPNKKVDIQQFHANGGNNQLWRIVDAGDNHKRIESVFSPGDDSDDNQPYVLDVKLGDGADEYVQVYPWHDDDNQKWDLTAVP